MPHAERPRGPVAAAQKCATHGPLWPVTARRPLRISVIRFTGTSIRRAGAALSRRVNARCQRRRDCVPAVEWAPRGGQAV